MSSLNEVIKSMTRTRDLKRSLGITSSVPDILKKQVTFNNSIATTNNLVKIANLQNKYLSTAINQVFNSAVFFDSSVFPTDTISAIANIQKNNERLFGSLNQTYLKDLPSSALYLTKSLNYALDNSFLKLAKEAATYKRWGLIDDAVDVTKKAVTISEKFIDSEGITKEDLKSIETSLNAITETLTKSDADANSTFWKFLAFMSFLLTLISEVRNWTPKPEYATKQEIEALFKDQNLLLEKKLKEINQNRTTKRESKILERPKKKSFVVTVLPIGYDLSVILTKHKWAFITYNMDDSLKSGWVLKKYLKKHN
jgi:hypothetical protein